MKKDLILDTKEKITKEGLENSSAKIFSKNTILLAMYTEDMGRTSILGIEGTTNQAICGLEVNSKILSKYLFYFLKSQKNVIDRLGKGGAQPNINQNKVKNLEIVFPENKDTQKTASLPNIEPLTRGIVLLLQENPLFRENYCFLIVHGQKLVYVYPDTPLPTSSRILPARRLHWRATPSIFHLVRSSKIAIRCFGSARRMV